MRRVNSKLLVEAEQAWQKLTLANNFIFQKVMQNEELCKKIISEIIGVEIVKVEYPEYEKTIDIRYDSKSIRLDVYVKDDEETVYNIEIQNINNDSIPKRGRYYQSLIDLDLIQKGCRYDELNKSYVIFICTFDYYGVGYYRYTFVNTSRDGIEYGDGTTKIIINSKGTKGEASEDLIDFLNCINGYFSATEFSDKLKSEIDNVKRSDKFRREYMTLYLYEEEIKRKSLEQGRSEGILFQTIKYYKKGILTLEEAIKDTCLSKQEFLEKVESFSKDGSLDNTIEG